MDKQKVDLKGERAALVRSVFSGDSVSNQGESVPNGQLGSLVEDFELLKTEIKQTLIDLREVVMKDRTVFADHASQPKAPEDLLDAISEMGVKADLHPGYLLKATPETAPEEEGPRDMSTLREMGQIFQWILDIREAGLSPVVLAEFLESYVRSIGVSTQAGRLAMFVVKIVQQMKTDDLDRSSPSSLETYGLYIGELGNLLAGEVRSGPSRAESAPDSLPETISAEDEDGQSDSHSVADDSFDHRCSHCYEWHDSGHKYVQQLDASG